MLCTWPKPMIPRYALSNSLGSNCYWTTSNFASSGLTHLWKGASSFIIGKFCSFTHSYTYIRYFGSSPPTLAYFSVDSTIHTVSLQMLFFPLSWVFSVPEFNQGFLCDPNFANIHHSLVGLLACAQQDSMPFSFLEPVNC